MSTAQISSLPIPHPELASILVEVLDRGGFFSFSAHGSSMWPFVLSGDRLTIQPLAGRPIRVADILLYRAPGQHLTAHRVIGMENGCLRVRGDRLRAPLELVEQDAVLGRVVALERNGKKSRLVWARTLALAWIAVRGCLRAIHRVVFAPSKYQAHRPGLHTRRVGATKSGRWNP